MTIAASQLHTPLDNIFQGKCSSDSSRVSKSHSLPPFSLPPHPLQTHTLPLRPECTGGNKTFMPLGILTQCHFPSLTWKECTSHNRLHHPAIKHCQGTAFWAKLVQLWREKEYTRPTHRVHRGHFCFLNFGRQHAALNHSPCPASTIWQSCDTAPRGKLLLLSAATAEDCQRTLALGCPLLLIIMDAIQQTVKHTHVLLSSVVFKTLDCIWIARFAFNPETLLPSLNLLSFLLMNFCGY